MLAARPTPTALKLYQLVFSDGTSDNSGTLTNVIKIYSSAGTYTVRFTVVDNTSLSSGTTQPIDVTSSPASSQTASVLDIQISLKIARTSSGSATGIVTAVNWNVQALPAATEAASWSSIVSRTSTGTTATIVKVAFSAPSMRSTGCFKLTLTSIKTDLSLCGTDGVTSAIADSEI